MIRLFIPSTLAPKDAQGRTLVYCPACKIKKYSDRPEKHGHDCKGPACTHIGELVREQGCMGCGSGRAVKVFACSLFNETQGQSVKLPIKSCQGCESYQPAVAAG